MKCSELQIGDWVDFYHPYEPEKKIVTRHHVTEIFECGLVGISNHQNPVHADHIESIKITPEILERNGFNKVPQQGCSNPYYWLLDVYEEGTDALLYSIKVYKTLFRGMYISIDNYGDCEPIKFSKQIEYFHELQHALRLCGLSDLADNIKLEE